MKHKILILIVLLQCLVMLILWLCEKEIKGALAIGGIALFLVAGMWDPPSRHNLRPEPKRTLSCEDSYEISQKMKKYSKVINRKNRGR